MMSHRFETTRSMTTTIEAIIKARWLLRSIPSLGAPSRPSSLSPISNPTHPRRFDPSRSSSTLSIVNRLDHSLEGLYQLISTHPILKSRIDRDPRLTSLRTFIRNSLGDHRPRDDRSNPFKLSFYGSRLSRRSEVIDYLLINPQRCSNSDSNHLINDRYARFDQPHPSSSLKIEFDQRAAWLGDQNVLRLNNRWLKDNELEIEEVQVDWRPSPSISFLDHPPTGDLIIIVLDALRENHLVDRQLLPPSIHQPVMILLNSNHPQLTSNLVLDSDLEPLTLRINSTAALMGLRTVSEDPKSAYDRIQGSGLNEVRSGILKLLNPTLTDTGSAISKPKPIQLLKSLSICEYVLSITIDQLIKISEDVMIATTRLYEHRRKFEELSSRVNQVLSEDSSLDQRSNATQTRLREILNKQIGFWKLPFVYDQVDYRVIKTLEDIELSEIEKKLIFQAGQLKMLQLQSEDLLDALMEDPILKQYQTPTMINRILQGQSKSKHYRSSTALATREDLNQFESIKLFDRRRSNLFHRGGPIAVLQNRSHQLILQNLTSGLGLSILSFFSYLGHHDSLSGGKTLDSFKFLTDNYPSIPCFILVYLIYRSQSSWKKSVDQFVSDFTRWRENLNHDLTNHKQLMIEGILLTRLKVDFVTELDTRIKRSLDFQATARINPRRGLDNDHDGSESQCMVTEAVDSQDKPIEQPILDLRKSIPNADQPYGIKDFVNQVKSQLDLAQNQIYSLFSPHTLLHRSRGPKK